MLLLALTSVAFFTGAVFGLNNGLARLPPMGWISRQRFGCNVDCIRYPDDCISEHLVRSMADAIVSRGFLAAGYQYIVLGDCWMDMNRDNNGQLRGDLHRFPSGITASVNYVHSRGLKFGLYIDLGNNTCGGFPGSQDYLNTDAQTLSEWGVDYITVGACGIKDIQSCNEGYVTFGHLLNQTGRQIFYSCDWPQVLRHLGSQANMTAVVQTCNQYRTYDDMTDNWQTLLNVLNYYASYDPLIKNYSSPGSFNDPDQLVIGDYGLSTNQQQIQMSLWSMMSAPLFVSADLRAIGSESVHILFNRIALSIDQDNLGILGLETRLMGDVHIWQKPIEPSGSYAIAFIYTNIAGGPTRVSVLLSDIGLTTAARFLVTEAFTQRSYGILKPWYTLNCEINPNGALLFQFIALY
jgi:hypothetical protein